MNNTREDSDNTRSVNTDSEYYIDITGEVCPMTFVKTRLMIDKMPAGHKGEVRLKGREPLENVPRSIGEHGHLVVSIEAEQGEPKTGIHRLIFHKN